MREKLLLVDSISSVMNEAGDKMVTNGKGTPNRPTSKRGKAGPATTVKFGSASVPVYQNHKRQR
jgi:hypothetical protein